MRSQLGFGLVGNSFLTSLELLFIEQIVVLERLHVLVKLKDERAGSGDIVGENLLLTHARQVLHDGAERVAVGDHDDILACEHLRADSVVPVGQDTVHSDLERLSPGKDIGRQVSVPALKPWVSLVVQVQLRRRDVVAPAPLEHLLLAVLLSCLSLIEALQGAIVPLIESPGLVVGDPERVHLLHHRVLGLNGTS